MRRFRDQWYRSKTGKWIEATETTFSYDATAKAGVRLDYSGGYDETSNRFYLKNGGFFSESTLWGQSSIAEKLKFLLLLISTSSICCSDLLIAQQFLIYFHTYIHHFSILLFIFVNISNQEFG